MTYDRFKHLIFLLSKERPFINSVYQLYDKKKKTDDFVVVVVSDTFKGELDNLSNEGYGYHIFSSPDYGLIELWIYELTLK